MEAKSWRPNAFVFKILTSKIFDIKILQTLFAKPAPSKTFREYGGEGGTPISHSVPEPATAARRFISRRNSQPLLPPFSSARLKPSRQKTTSMIHG